MPDLLVRNLDDKAIAGLKSRAKQNGRSLQAEAREILTDASVDRRARAIEGMERIHRMLAGRRFSDSAELIREDRDNNEPYR